MFLNISTSQNETHTTMTFLPRGAPQLIERTLTLIIKIDRNRFLSHASLLTIYVQLPVLFTVS